MKILITGASGFLGYHLASSFSAKPGTTVLGTVLNNQPPSRIEIVKLDISNKGDLENLLRSHTFDAVIHCAANASIAACEEFSELAWDVNCRAVASIVNKLDPTKTHLVYCSTDMIFDGLHAPYSESAPPSPMHNYGKTKTAGEREAQIYSGKCTVIRFSLMYGNGPVTSPSFLGWLRQGLLKPEGIKMYSNEYRTALYIEDAVNAVWEILKREATGIFNIAGPERLSREKFALCYAQAFGFDSKKIHGITLPPVSKTEIYRPPDLSLDISHAQNRLGFSPKYGSEAFEEMTK